ncbi:uncharacterized protein [Procambarus clarkii]|uniref:uncharacterized protein isoform X1 n=1 Tax=Procambarus clarkii TaxID=6728 RepID=UPI003742AFBA
MAGLRLWLVSTLVCGWLTLTLQGHTGALHEESRQEVDDPAKLPYLTQEDNGIMVTVLMTGFVLRQWLYWVISIVPSYTKELDSGEAPAWIRREYRIFKDVQQDVDKGVESIAPKSPFIPKSLKEFQFADTTKEKFDSPNITFTIDKSVHLLDKIFSSPPAPEHFGFIMDHYAENLDQLLGTTRLRELFGIVKITDENLVGYIDWVKEEVISAFGELKRQLIKRYSSGKLVGSKTDIVNAMDKIFIIFWRVHSNPGLLGDTLKTGVKMHSLKDLAITTLGAVKGALDYYQIELKMTASVDSVPLALIVPELHRNPTAHLPADFIKKLLRQRREPRGTNLAKYSTNDLFKILGKYEVEKTFVIFTVVVNSLTHHAWLDIEKHMGLLIEAYQKIGGAQASNFTLDIPTLKRLLQSKGQGHFGLPEDFLRIIKNLGWKKSRGIRTLGSLPSIFPDYQARGGFWSVLRAFFGYKVAVDEADNAVVVTPEENLDEINKFDYLSLGCPLEADPDCPLHDERNRPIVPVYQGSPPPTVQPTGKYATRMTMDTTLLEIEDVKFWEDYIGDLRKLGSSVVAASSWEEARTGLGLSVTHHQPTDNGTLVNATIIEMMKCLTGPMCADCKTYVKYQSGEPLCCYACLTRRNYLEIEEDRCVCYYGPYAPSKSVV